ncbi:hypothetical protein [Streptomyces albidoflavus]|uniref:hypothetical protein n=1 Tax=Streptomyces albidoflavus TaxID=1886 RepID=UPI00101E4DB6|nr:hypothetical protein [Streptomyces albidoflavus]RZD89303.1 hypothetical protein C0Q60_03580 [Streptomyces albidoflavus]RZE04962.1 hypothetical protein C0Q62_03495 [Streptomyces albidoflavus]
MARKKKTSPTIRALRADAKQASEGKPVTPDGLRNQAEHRNVKKPLSAETRRETRVTRAEERLFRLKRDKS